MGTHTITAEYSGDTYHLLSSSSLTLEVVKISTTTVITPSVNPALAGSLLTITVTVSAPGNGVPTGQVTLYEVVPPGTLSPASHPALATQTLVNGVATFTLAPLSPGMHTLLAVYSGDEHFAAGAPALYDLMVEAWPCHLPFVSTGSQP